MRGIGRKYVNVVSKNQNGKALGERSGNVV